MECSLESQAACVEEARQMGCEVFVSGPGNAAKFSTRYDLPIVEISIRYIDYACAIRSGIKQGCKKIGIARHRYSPSVDISMLQSLMEMPLKEIVFEGSSELYELIKESDCDAVIGTSLATDAAIDAGKIGILIYSSKEAIRDACLRASDMVRDLYVARQNREITNAILNNAQFGIIVTDTVGRVTMFNKTAQRYTGVAPSQIRNHLLTDFLPNLSITPLLKSNQMQNDAFRLVDGAMMRCMQERILLDRRTIGVLTTIYPDSHSRKKPVGEEYKANKRIYRWNDLVAVSPVMKKLVEQGNNLAKLNYPVMLLGVPGSGREAIANCIHSASRRSDFPCITIDFSTFPGEDAAHILLGYEKQDCSITGLLANANGGSVILKNVSMAQPIARACLTQALSTHQIFRPGMGMPLSLDIALFTIATQEEYEALPKDFQSFLSVCQLEVPMLSERQEDIGPLFLQYLSQMEEFPRRITLNEQLTQLLQFHEWPGQLRELQAVSTRYAIALNRVEKPTPRTQYLMLLQAIGENVIFNEILQLHPSLMQRPIEEKGDFLEGVDALKSLMKYSNDTVADKLAISRTTLWRILQSVSGD